MLISLFMNGRQHIFSRSQVGAGRFNRSRHANLDIFVLMTHIVVIYSCGLNKSSLKLLRSVQKVSLLLCLPIY